MATTSAYPRGSLAAGRAEQKLRSLAVQQLTQLAFGDEVPAHVEFARVDGKVTCFGLPLVRFTSEERLDEIMQIHEDFGCPIFNRPE